MKRPRTKKTSAGQGPARDSLPRQEVESQDSDGNEEPSQMRAPRPGKSGADENENDKAAINGRPLRRRRFESDGDNGVRRSLGFAYLRESGVSTEKTSSVHNHRHHHHDHDQQEQQQQQEQKQHQVNKPNDEEDQKQRAKRRLSTSSRSSLTKPFSAQAFPVDDNELNFASPRSVVSTTRGFSHLRESLSFALPRDVSYVSRHGSVVIPRRTPPAAASNDFSAGVIVPSASRSSASTRTRSDRTAVNARPPRPISLTRGSAQSFLSTESAVEHLNSTGSLGELISSRESPRSCRAAASLSVSTLGPLDLSPILREERRPRRRHHSGRRHTTNGMPIDVPASFIANTAHNGTAGVSRAHAEPAENMRRHVVGCLRASLCAGLTLLLLCVWAVVAAPLFMRMDHPEYTFVRDYVDTLSEMQFIYEVPYMSLRLNATAQLYLRVLSETTERVERAILQRRPPESDTSQQALFLRRMLRVHQAIQHRARLYARSRFHSRLHQFLIDPMRDVWAYGFVRHGLATTLRDLFWEPSWRRLWARVKDVSVCLRQDEKMPCPTLTFRREEQHEADGIVIEPSVASGSRAEIEHLRRLLEYIRQNSRRNNREYNHLHAEELAGAFVP